MIPFFTGLGVFALSLGCMMIALAIGGHYAGHLTDEQEAEIGGVGCIAAAVGVAALLATWAGAAVS